MATWSYLWVAGIIPGLNYQFMNPLELIVQGFIQSDDSSLYVNDKVAFRVTLTSVDFIKHQTVIAFVLVCGKHLQRHKNSLMKLESQMLF